MRDHTIHQIPYPICGGHVRVGDLITYVGAFAHYRVLSTPEPCSDMPDRVVFEARNETSNRKHVLKIRLKARQPVVLIEKEA